MPRNMPSIDYQWLKSKLRIAHLLARMGWRPSEGHGQQLRGPCPFCGSLAENREPSPRRPVRRREFSVHTARHIFQCFRCRASGNALDLWASYRKLPIHDAALELDSMVHDSHAPNQATTNP